MKNRFSRTRETDEDTWQNINGIPHFATHIGEYFQIITLFATIFQNYTSLGNIDFALISQGEEAKKREMQHDCRRKSSPCIKIWSSCRRGSSDIFLLKNYLSNRGRKSFFAVYPRISFFEKLLIYRGFCTRPFRGPAPGSVLSSTVGSRKKEGQTNFSEIF